MKTPFKTSSFITVILVGAFVFSPFFSMAQEKAAQILAGDFCNRFDEIEEKVVTDVTAKEKSILDARKEGESLLQEKWNKERDERVAAWKNDDAYYADLFASLDKKGATEEIQAGVATFKSDIGSATTIFRGTVEKTITTYQAAFQKAVAERSRLIDGIITKYKAGIVAANEEARAQCGDKKDPLKVRNAYKTKLKDLEETLRNDIKQTAAIEASLEALGVTKKESLDTAEASFKEAIASAGDKLKEVIGEDMEEEAKEAPRP